jgi:hypothetical protein
MEKLFIPRSYTLKTIAEVIGTPFEAFTTIAPDENMLPAETDAVEIHSSSTSAITTTQRIILSAGLCLTVLILAGAYIAQSATFPETSFEMLLFWAAILLIITGILFFLWKSKK